MAACLPACSVLSSLRIGCCAPCLPALRVEYVLVSNGRAESLLAAGCCWCRAVVRDRLVGPLCRGTGTIWTSKNDQTAGPRDSHRSNRQLQPPVVLRDADRQAASRRAEGDTKRKFGHRLTPGRIEADEKRRGEHGATHPHHCPWAVRATAFASIRQTDRQRRRALSPARPCSECGWLCVVRLEWLHLRSSADCGVGDSS